MWIRLQLGFLTNIESLRIQILRCYIAAYMKIPLREGNLDSGLLQGIKNGVIEPAADPFTGGFLHIDPYLQ